LFGFSAWWWVVAGVVLVVAGYRRIGHPERAREHPLHLGILGFGLVLLSSAALEALRFFRPPAPLPHRSGGVFGDVLGNALARLLGFNGATLLLIALFAVGWSLFSGMSWIKLMERIGAGFEHALAMLRQRAEERRDRERGAQAMAERAAVFQAKHEEGVHEPVVVVPPLADVPKSERAVKERQRARSCGRPHGAGRRRAAPRRCAEVGTGGQGAAAAAVRRHARLAAAAARAARRRAAGAGGDRRRSPRIHLRPNPAQARRFRRRGARAGRLPWPRDHAFRNGARDRRQGRADRQPDNG